MFEQMLIIQRQISVSSLIGLKRLRGLTFQCFTNITIPFLAKEEGECYVRIVPYIYTKSIFNSGLKQALATVNDYNPLMKDFPLDDLLAATELDKIRAALSAIFTHLKKIRSTKYPIQRALRLVEAISRDLSSQLLKVCYLL